MKRNVLILLAVILLVIGSYWGWTHGYIEVSALSAGAGDTQLQITDQANNHTTTISLKNNRVKKMIRRGQYEILVRQGQASYFAVAKTHGWLGTTTIDAKPSPEKHRQFIGDNPGPCIAYNNQELLSFGCSDSYRNMLIHIPATTKQPSYALKPEKTTDGVIEGITQTSEGLVVILKRPTSADNDSTPAHTAYILNNKSELTGGIALKGLQDNKTYTVLPYKQGVLLYENAGNKLLYFPTRASIPTEIQPEISSKMTPYAVSVNGEMIVIAASTASQNLNPDDPATTKLKSEVTIINDQQKRHISLARRYASVAVCGNNRLCGLLNKRLEIYDISSTTPKLLFSVTGIHQMAVVGSRLLAVRDNEILSLDPQKQAGSIDFSDGDYRECGFQAIAPATINNGYTLCLINNKSSKVALLIDPANPDVDSIDKKVSQLIKTRELKSLTIYGSLIHYTPEVGAPVYDQKIRGFRYSPDKIQSAAAAIYQAVDKLGIDRNKYQIINLLGS